MLVSAAEEASPSPVAGAAPAADPAEVTEAGKNRQSRLITLLLAKKALIAKAPLLVAKGVGKVKGALAAGAKKPVAVAASSLGGLASLAGVSGVSGVTSLAGLSSLSGSPYIYSNGEVYKPVYDSIYKQDYYDSTSDYYDYKYEDPIVRPVVRPVVKGFKGVISSSFKQPSITVAVPIIIKAKPQKYDYKPEPYYPTDPEPYYPDPTPKPDYYPDPDPVEPYYPYYPSYPTPPGNGDNGDGDNGDGDNGDGDGCGDNGSRSSCCRRNGRSDCDD